MQVESPYPGCRVANCGNEAKNFHRGIGYCAHHAREARDGDLEAEIKPCAKYDICVFGAPELRLLKFGRSINPGGRLKQISDGSPAEITLLGSCLDPDPYGSAIGAIIHTFLDPHRARGGWFKDNEDSRMIAGFILAGRPGEIIRMAKL